MHAFLALAILGAPWAAQGRIETLRWQNTDPDPARIDGYIVHSGPGYRSYDTHKDVGSLEADADGVFSYDIVVVPNNAIVHVAVTAYVTGPDGQPLESTYSNDQERGPAGGDPPNQAPGGAIDAPVGPVTLTEGESVSFAGTGSDPDGDLPLTYRWDFGGSGVAPSTAEDPGAVTFATAGTFTVSFTVTDAQGLADATPATRVVTVEPPPVDPAATDFTIPAGLTYLQFDGSEPVSPSGVEYMTGGAAAGDYDGDGWVDLYVTRLDATDILFRNRGDGSFDDVTAQAGLGRVAWGDLDNDGDLDLYVTAAGEAASRFYLFINDGAGGFSEQAVARGAAVEGTDPHFGFSVTFGDYDRDGWLDIHTTEWRLDADNPQGARSNARLLRNRGSAAPGYFEDRTDAAGVALEEVPIAAPGVSGVFALSSRFADLDADGWPDLLITGDYGTSRLMWNAGDGTFTDGTAAAGVGTEEQGTGSAVGDYDGDGSLDWFVTSLFYTCDVGDTSCSADGTGNRLYRNEGGRAFSDQTDAAGVRDGSYGAATAFYDLENDGDLDLVMTNGDFAAPGAATPDPLRVWANDGSGQMTEISQDVGMVDEGAGRGLLTFDYDADGDLDLFVVNNAGSPVLYRNDTGSQNRWLRVKTQGTDSNRDGIGAVVLLWTDLGAPPQVREIEAGSHFLGQSERTAHFGLGGGTDPVDRVLVYWPATQRTNEFLDVARNTTLVAVEPSASDSPEDPEEPSPAPDPEEKDGGSGSGLRCGLLGIEPLLILPFLARRKRRRQTAR
jgi:hypothetical protein